MVLAEVTSCLRHAALHEVGVYFGVELVEFAARGVSKVSLEIGVARCGLRGV